MSRYSKISRRMWADEKFRNLSAPKPNAQTLWVYLLTGPHNTNVPGVFSIGEAGLAEAIGWPTEGLRKAFGELFAKGMAKADWDARLVYVPNAIKHNAPANPNVIKGWHDGWDELPECALKETARIGVRATLAEIDASWAEVFDKACPKGSANPFANPLAKGLGNQEQEQEQEQEEREPPLPGLPDPVETVMAHWRRVMQSPRSALDKKRRDRIEWALETYGPDDCLRAIDGCARDPFSMGENDRNTKFNDPTLIFRDAAHVEKFVALAPKPTPERPKPQPRPPLLRPDETPLTGPDLAESLRKAREGLRNAG